MVVYAYNSTLEKIKLLWVWGQPGQQSEALSQKPRASEIRVLSKQTGDMGLSPRIRLKLEGENWLYKTSSDLSMYAVA